MCLHNALANMQSEAQTAAHRPRIALHRDAWGAMEHLPDPRLFLRWQPRSMVMDGNTYTTLTVMHTHVHWLVIRGILESVRQEIREHLSQAVGIRDDPQRFFCRQVQTNRALRHRQALCLHLLAYDLGQVTWCRRDAKPS